MSVFTSAVLQGLNAIDVMRMGNHCGYEPDLRAQSIASVVGASQLVMQHTLNKLSRAGIITVKRGPGGGYGVTQEQLRTKRVLDVLEALGQPCVAPEGSRASDLLQQRFYDSCDLTLQEFFG